MARTRNNAEMIATLKARIAAYQEVLDMLEKQAAARPPKAQKQLKLKESE